VSASAIALINLDISNVDIIALDIGRYFLGRVGRQWWSSSLPRWFLRIVDLAGACAAPRQLRIAVMGVPGVSDMRFIRKYHQKTLPAWHLWRS